MVILSIGFQAYILSLLPLMIPNKPSHGVFRDSNEVSPSKDRSPHEPVVNYSITFEVNFLVISTIYFSDHILIIT